MLSQTGSNISNDVMEKIAEIRSRRRGDGGEDIAAWQNDQHEIVGVLRTAKLVQISDNAAEELGNNPTALANTLNALSLDTKMRRPLVGGMTASVPSPQ